jgi:hypothetical protein
MTRHNHILHTLTTCKNLSKQWRGIESHIMALETTHGRLEIDLEHSKPHHGPLPTN